MIPSLLALTEVLELSNTKFNKDRTKVKLLIKANIDQNCFELELSLVQHILENLQKFLGTEISPSL